MRNAAYTSLLLIMIFIGVLTACGSNHGTATPMIATGSAVLAGTATEIPTTTSTPFVPPWTAMPTATYSSMLKTAIAEEECVGSFYSFAYFLPIYEGPERISEIILPRDPWKLEPTGSQFELDSVDAVRDINGQVEIWFREKPKLGVSDIDSPRNIYIYRPESMEWKVVPREIGDTGVRVNQLFVTSDGAVWGRNVWTTWDESLKIDRVPVLSKYNETEAHFEFDQSTIEIGELEHTQSFGNWPVVVFDPVGVFWIFIQRDGLYRYDPIAKEITKKIETPAFIVEEAVLAPEGILYFRLQLLSVVLEKSELLQYDLVSGNVTVIENPDEPWPGFANLLVDQNGNLWLGANGWRQPDGSWHQLFPETMPFLERGRTPLSYNWSYPNLILESSNGILWFTKDTKMGYDATAWYNPQTGNGCWFTTEYTNIVEDSHQTLWMVADGKLYRYDLNH